MNEVLVPDSPVRENTCIPTWQPGQTLPCRRPSFSPVLSEAHVASSLTQIQVHVASSLTQIQSMLQSMQNTIDTNFKNVKERLADLEDRMMGVEEKLKLTNQSGTPTSSSCESQSDFGRKHRSPPELQVRIFVCAHIMVYMCQLY